MRCPESIAWVLTLALLGSGASCVTDEPAPDTLAGETETETEVVAPGDDDLAAIQEWLVSRAYQSWERHDPEPAPGMSGGARVYLSPALADSLRAGASVHPPGSAAVREIVDAQDPTRQLGWALVHKLDESTEANSDAWFFYEVFSLEVDGQPQTAERGPPGCVGCHGEGVDFVRSQLD